MNGLAIPYQKEKSNPISTMVKKKKKANKKTNKNKFFFFQQ